MSRVILNINTTSGNKNSDNEDKKKKNGGGGNYMNNVLDYMDEIKVGFKFGDGFEKLPSPIANKNYKWFDGAEGPMKNCKVVEIKDNSHLICHIKTHTEEKTYQCSQCDKPSEHFFLLRKP